MPSPIKKVNPIFPLIERSEAIDLFNVLLFWWKYEEGIKNTSLNKDEYQKNYSKYLKLNDAFAQKYGHSFLGIARDIEQVHSELVAFFHRILSGVSVDSKNISAEAIFDFYVKLIKKSEIEPVLIGRHYSFKGFYYSVNGHYSHDQLRLSILEDFDKERRHFEKLKAKFDESPSSNITYDRPRIPENIRIEVWRRDSGKCARCGNREKLEYDHIVPISKGGSNTARNIELLCEKCNRSKSNNIV
jgi:hypothetical protein